MYGSLSVKGAIFASNALAVRGDHLVGALHHAERRGERAARRVGERLAGRQDRLLADDARALDFLDVAGRRR